MRLNSGIWIIIIIVILLIALAYKEYYFIHYKGIVYPNYEQFISYPQSIDITKKIASDPEANSANTCYKQILNYIQKNPRKSVKFIDDVKTKFFDPSCPVKSDINFNNLTNGSMSQTTIF